MVMHLQNRFCDLSISLIRVSIILMQRKFIHMLIFFFVVLRRAKRTYKRH